MTTTSADIRSVKVSLAAVAVLLDGSSAQPRWAGFGYGPVSVVLAVLIVAFVSYLANSRIDAAQVETAGE